MMDRIEDTLKLIFTLVIAIGIVVGLRLYIYHQGFQLHIPYVDDVLFYIADLISGLLRRTIFG